MDLRIPLSPPQVVDGITLKFPAKLWRIVNNCRTGSISWEDNGNSIRINKKQFEHEFLSATNFFKTRNFPSFIRQLNIYGFRKVPAATRWQESGTVFEYKHDFFVRGHPEFLTEVVRNTAVRRTQRENAIKQAEAIIAQGNLTGKLPEKEQCNILLTDQPTKSDSYKCHPLLNTPGTSVLKYGVPVGTQQDNQTSITTVYMHPRLSVCDMQTMSPSKLHHQMADLLPAITPSDDDDEDIMELDSSFDQVDMNITPEDEQELPSLDSNNNIPPTKTLNNQILFLPSSKDNSFDSNNMTCNYPLSQESIDMKQKQLMFSSVIDNGECDDEFDQPINQSLIFSCDDEQSLDTNDDSLSQGKSFEFTDNLINSIMCNSKIGELEEFNQNFNMADTLATFGEEQGYLTPAYYNPDTGTVTLLLPNLTPEA